MRIQIANRIKYDQQYEVGQVVDHLADADAVNLIAGGYAVALTSEEGEAPVGGSGQEDPVAEPVREGSDAPAEPAASPEPGALDPLACPHGCRGGAPFKSLAALAAHLKTKH